MTNQIKGLNDGFDIDFGTITTEFPKCSPNLKLHDFMNYWNEKNLDCLFANRFDPRELVESIGDINRTLVNHINSNNLYKGSASNHNFVIALYFLLCLYVKQPSRFQTKIRFTIDNGIAISEFISAFENEETKKDIDFTWKKLRSLEAIIFVEELQIFGPSMIYTRGFSTKKKKLSEAIQSQVDQPILEHKSQQLNKFFIEEVKPALDQINQIKQVYNETKDVLELNKYYYDKGTTEGIDDSKSESLDKCLDEVKALVDAYMYSYPSFN